MSNARINITLHSESDGVQKKKELPLKLLVLGRFSGYSNNKTVVPIKRWNISKENADHVMAKVSPCLDFQVPNKIKKDGDDLSVNLTFEKLKDFHPDHLLLKIPELSQLLAMRNLLKDLKAQLLDNPLLRRELEKLLSHRDRRAQIHQELKQHAPLEEDSHE